MSIALADRVTLPAFFGAVERGWHLGASELGPIGLIRASAARRATSPLAIRGTQRRDRASTTSSSGRAVLFTSCGLLLGK